MTSKSELSPNLVDKHLAQTKHFQTADGRSIAYLDLGNAKGKPVFFFHGLPGSRAEAIALHSSALEHGYRLISPDRPGMGASDKQPGRNFLDWPKDIIEMADALAFKKFGVIGISGGGPFALACAHAISERLDFAIDIAGLAPMLANPELLKQMSLTDQFFAKTSQRLPIGVLQFAFSMMGFYLKRVESADGFVKLMGDAISEPDRQLASQEGFGRFLVKDAQESFRQGAGAVALETKLSYNDWGFSLADIQMPVHLLHGREDKLVPFTFSEQKAKMLPQNVFTPLDEVGHFFLLSEPDFLFSYISRIRGKAKK